MYVHEAKVYRSRLTLFLMILCSFTGNTNARKDNMETNFNIQNEKRSSR